MKKLILSAVSLLIVMFSFAAKVDTVSVFSARMKKSVKTVIITPAGYNSAKELPVVYLLHGYSDNYSGWLKNAKGVDKLSDQYNMIIVCPDGAYSSWYWDSPLILLFNMRHLFLPNS